MVIGEGASSMCTYLYLVFDEASVGHKWLET